MRAMNIIKGGNVTVEYLNICVVFRAYVIARRVKHMKGGAEWLI